jgi:hypothetical protein
MLVKPLSTGASFFVIQHKEQRETNKMAIHIVLLTVFDMLRPTQSFSCLWCPLLTINRVRVPARATGAKPNNPPRRAKPSASLTHATTRAPCCVRRAQCAFCDDPDRPLTVGTPSPRVDPRCSASELHVLCSGSHQSSDAEIARG